MREHVPEQLKHPQWHGLHFADLFFPLFLFVVGISMTLSTRSGSALQVMRRVAILLTIGILLTSFKHGAFYPTGVLQHIAGSYLIAWLILQAPRRLQPVIGAAIVVGIWGAFELWDGGDGTAWDMESTLAHTVDGWLYGNFSTEGTFPTIMSAVTVLGGALIGYRLQEVEDRRRLARETALHALWLIALGVAISGLVPLNKRVWSPSFTLVTLGSSFAWLSLLIWIVEVRRKEARTTFLIELGANPIAIYVSYIALRTVIDDFRDSAPYIAPFGSPTAGAMIYSFMWLVVWWAAARFLYRRKVFIKI